MILYQITRQKLNERFDKYLIGKDLLHDLYIYRTDIILYHAIYKGTAKEVINKLTDERFLNYVK